MSSSGAGRGYSQGLLRAELFVGVVVSISVDAVRVNMSEAGLPSGTHVDGIRYGRGEVGEFVLIEGQGNIVLGRVVEVYLPERERGFAAPGRRRAQSLDVVGKVQLLGSTAVDTLRVTAGVETYPRLGDGVYSAPHDFIADLPKLTDRDVRSGVLIQLALGHVGVGLGNLVSVTPEKLFGRHCAVLGATGGGKSWTTARIVEECRRFAAKVILIDATGEYRDLSGSDVVHCHLGSPVETACASESLALPPACFVESDFVALFEAAGKVQGPKMRAAIRSLRLAKLCPEVASGDGVIKKINRVKAPVEDAERRSDIVGRLSDPRQEFEVGNLVAQIEQECVYPDAFGAVRGTKDPTQWGAESGEFSYCLTLVSRIEGILASRAFDFIFRSNHPSVTERIDRFSQGGEKLLRICLSGVAHEFGAREVVANTIGRHLLTSARSGLYRMKPMVVIVDEAHNFLGRQYGGEESVAKLDAFELVAKEGRKHGLNICLVTQRPRDVTEGVLSQVGTLVVHRLTNDRDRDVVSRACGEIDRDASAFLPNLRQGEALIIGIDFPIPLVVRITPPRVRPRSDGPNFQKHWKLGHVAESVGR